MPRKPSARRAVPASAARKLVSRPRRQRGDATAVESAPRPRPESLDGVALARRSPSPSLRRWVVGYQDYRVAGSTGHPRSHLPSPEVNLIVNLDAPLHVHDALGQPTSLGAGDAFVAGLHTTAATTRIVGVERGVQVDLTPVGAHLLFGRVPMTELAERVVRIEDLLGPERHDVIGALMEARTAEERFDALEAFLARKLQDVELTPELHCALDGLAASHGTTRIADLARRVGWSEKRLVRAFRQTTGQRPKTVARLLRFDRARRLASQNVSWAEIAIECGYHDQAHLSREFSALTGESPTRLRPRVDGRAP